MALITYLTRTYFADRVLEDALAEQLKALGIRRPLIVSDLDGMRDEPLSRLSDALPPGCKARVHRITAARVAHDKAIAEVRAAFMEGHCDGYVGLGGEAALSLARRASHEQAGPARQRSRDAARPIQIVNRPPLIAIPTTTACVGLQPLVTSHARGQRRVSLGKDPMLPDAVLCDPTLTLEQDGPATAAAGMDALTHCIEAYLGTTWNPPADGIALDGIRRAVASLDLAVQDGTNLEARREMMAAALDAGLASQKGLGAVEALSHALEDEICQDAAHGYLHAALLPVVLAFNAPAIGARMAALRDTIHVTTDEDVSRAMLELGTSIRLPSRLSGLCVDDALRRLVAQRALEHPATRTNPRHVTAADYVWMLEQAS